MKRISFIVVVGAALVLALWISQQPVSAETSGKVLLVMIEEEIGPADTQNLRTNEAMLTKMTLEEAGFTVVLASASGRTFVMSWVNRTDEEGRPAEDKDLIFESDLTLAEVNVADYVGFFITCLALPGSSVKPEEVALAKHIVAAGKPVAAQRDGIFTLAEAGALVGKRYSRDSGSSSDPRFAGGIYSGDGVVQDGKIITATYCPALGKEVDQTVELTQTLIAELKKK